MIFQNSKKNFLGIEHSKKDNYQAIIVPYPLENSVSYGTGTKKGPSEIILASHQLELYDEDLKYEPIKKIGIRTLKVKQKLGNTINAISNLEKIIDSVLDVSKFPLILGGEHSITIGAINSITKRFKDLVLVQFDAHSDLRDEYKSDKFSHACTMRRCLDNKNLKLVSMGVRSTSEEEIVFIKNNKTRIYTFYAKDKKSWDLKKIKKFIQDKNVYITFDVDVFDPSLMPATGTPEPGGLFWDETLNLIKAISENSNVIGADITELAPIKNINSCNFIAAKLAYKLLSIIFNSKKSW